MFLTARTKSTLEGLNDSLPKIINTHTNRIEMFLLYQCRFQQFNSSISNCSRIITKIREVDKTIVLVAQSCPSLCDPMDCSRQAPLSMDFSRQEYWSGLPFPSPDKAMVSMRKVKQGIGNEKTTFKCGPT